MVRRWAWVVMVALTACPAAEEPAQCQQVPVSLIIDERVAPFRQHTPPLGLISTPITVLVSAPITSCPGDDVQATARLFDPANHEVAFELTTAVTSPPDTVFGFVEANVTFTPASAGRYGLEVAFEPSLGRRAVVIDVAEDGHALPGLSVPLPARCDAGVWALTDERIACEERDRSLVSVVSSDGGSERFPGEGLVVVGNVLWTIDGGAMALERRVLTDAGLELTHALPGYTADDYPGMHDEAVAIRRRGSTVAAAVAQVGVIELLDGGVRETVVDLQYDQPTVKFREELDLQPTLLCAGCLADSFLGIEPRLLWHFKSIFNPLDGSAEARGVVGYARPLTATSDSPSVTLPYAPLGAAQPFAAFERVPLWLEQPLPGGRLAVAWHDGRQVRLTAWVPAQVLRIGRHHVVLRGPWPEAVQVVPLP